MPDTEPVVTIAAAALNLGFHDSPPSAQKLSDFALGLLNGSITSVAFDAPNWIDNFLLVGLFDCDGVVAAERRQWSSRELLDATPYAPNALDATLLGLSTETRFYPGSNSPGTCGEVSHYHMTWSIARRSASFDRLVQISPRVKALRQSQAFTFSVSSDAPVLWSVDGGATHGTIDANGRYVAPSNLSALDFVTIRATANDGSGRTGLAFVTLDTSTLTLIRACGPELPCH